MQSIQRRSGLNSSASNNCGWPSIQAMLARCRSPWHSRTWPPRQRWAHTSFNAICCTAHHCSSRCKSPICPGATSGSTKASAVRHSRTGAVAACSGDGAASAPPSCAMSATAACVCSLATCSARASMSSSATHPASSLRLSKACWSKRRISTAGSAPAASPAAQGFTRQGRASLPSPSTPTTSRYMCGAVRRLMRSSSWHAAKRSAAVLKSRKSSAKGFLNLYTCPPTSSSHEMCVSMHSTVQPA